MLQFRVIIGTEPRQPISPPLGTCPDHVGDVPTGSEPVAAYSGAYSLSLLLRHLSVSGLPQEGCGATTRDPFPSLLRYLHSPKFFSCRTSEKSTRNSNHCHTSKTRLCNPCVCHTSETPGGLLTSGQKPKLLLELRRCRSRSFALLRALCARSV